MFRSLVNKSVALGILTGLSLALATPSYGQATPATEAEKLAEQSCIEQADAKGFTLKDIVSIGADPTDADRVRVVLSLDKGGQLYKLTCYYSSSQNTVVGSDEAVDTTIRQPPYWLLIFPILGLPFLWWLGKRNSETTARVYDRSEGTRRVLAKVKNYGQEVNTYAGPGLEYKVTGTLADGQEVFLTGRYDNTWAELESGHWISTQYLETDPRYVQ